MLATAWVGWCLYWPFWTRQHDLRKALVETEASYRVCLQQPALSAADCAADRRAYQKLDRDLIAPSGISAYASFAGRSLRQAVVFILLLALTPPLCLFLMSRIAIALYQRAFIKVSTSIPRT